MEIVQRQPSEATGNVANESIANDKRTYFFVPSLRVHLGI